MTCSKSTQLSAWRRKCMLLMQFHLLDFSVAHLSSPSSRLHHRLSLLTEDFQSRSPGLSLAGQTASCSLTASGDTGASLCCRWLPALRWLPVPAGSGRLLDQGHRSPSGGTPPTPAPSSVCSVTNHVHLFVTPWMVAHQASLSFTISSSTWFQISHYAFSLNHATPLEIPHAPYATSNDRLLSAALHPEPPMPISRKTP